MIAEDGAIKIIAFGLTKSNPNGQGERLELITLSGFVGTPDYASPEQLNEQTVDVASDIYSLGVTLWFLLTGRQPFRGPMAQVMAKHLQSPPPFDELQGLPRSVVSLLAHMLEKDPAKRPISPAIWSRRSKSVWRRSKEKCRRSRRLTSSARAPRRCRN